MSSFVNNLFGIIGGSSSSLLNGAKGFIPIDGNGRTLQLTGQNANWLGLSTRQMQYWAYRYCSPLASVIDKLAECDINGQLEILKTDGTEDYTTSGTGKRLLRLLRKPNPIQTWEQFRGQQVIYKKIFGYCPVFPVMPFGMTDHSYATALWNIPPWLATPTFNPNFSFYSTNGSPILSYSVSIYGKSFEIKGDEVFTLYDGFVQDSVNQYQLPISKVAGLDYAVSNCCYAMEADNVLLRKRGPIGVWSNAAPVPGQQAAYLPMKPTDKDELQAELQKFGLAWEQDQYLISRNHVKYESAGFNVKELMTKETFVQSVNIIHDRFNVPVELSSFKDVTYENKNSAEKYLYQNNVIPNNTRDIRIYNDWFLSDVASIKLTCDFDELPIMQEDASREGQALQAKTAALQLQYKDDLITLNQYRQLLGHDSVEGGDIYYSETKAAMDTIAQANKIANTPANMDNVN